MKQCILFGTIVALGTACANRASDVASEQDANLGRVTPGLSALMAPHSTAKRRSPALDLRTTRTLDKSLIRPASGGAVKLGAAPLDCPSLPTRIYVDPSMGQDPGNNSGWISPNIPADAFRGKSVRYRGYLATTADSTPGVVQLGVGALWMRMDDANQQPVAYEDMSDRALTFTNESRPYEIVLKVPDSAATIVFGVISEGNGEVDWDHLALESVDPHHQVTAATDWFQAGDDVSDYSVSVDPSGTCGRAAAVLQSSASAPQGFSTIMEELAPDTLRGKRVKLTVNVKSDNLTGWAGVWMRVDSRTDVSRLDTAENTVDMTAFDNMQDRPITGTSDWHSYDVVLDVDSRAVDIAYGVLLDGPGKVSVDAASFTIVDSNTPVTQ